MLGARFIRRGLRPFVDFAVHQPPLHLYLLAWSGRLFGETVFGYRMLSVVSVAISGLLLFWLLRRFTGPLPALVAQALFLFSPSQLHAMNAVAEPPMLLFTMLGVTLLFLGTGRASAYASAVAFVIALLVKPTAIVVILAVVLSLVYARAWRRLVDLAMSGVVAAIVGLVWTFVLSGGIFAEIVRFQIERLGTRTAGMWVIDPGFAELRRLFHIESRGQWAVFCFKVFCLYPQTYLPAAFFVIAFVGIPIWTGRCAGGNRALGAFTVLWPVASLAFNFVAMEYVSAKYFVPFLAFTAFLLAAVVWLVVQPLPPRSAGVAAMVVTIALAGNFAWRLRTEPDPWYYGRADWIARHYPAVLSFSPMFFAATGAEPECGFVNPADTYGTFGEAVFGTTPHARRFRFSDERLIDCLRAHPETRVVVDFWYYYFTQPGSALREYLRAEGGGRTVFFSPDALAQWDHPRLVKDFVFR